MLTMGGYMVGTSYDVKVIFISAEDYTFTFFFCKPKQGIFIKTYLLTQTSWQESMIQRRIKSAVKSGN